ncbi:hypothetical protein [Campylobacter rectus]|uniref:hypothetical protein n=1 Tax=Campylobacter rectus TaxID=203 RepID=UPI0012FD0ABA|nr:hypothetical protein [Campylobacter rectus]
MRQQSYVATSHVQWGRWGFLRRCASSCKQTGAGLLCSCEAKPKQRKATLYFSFTTFATVALRA